MTTITPTPTIRRFNALVQWFDDHTLGQQDQCEPREIAQWLSRNSPVLFDAFSTCCAEIYGQPKREVV